MNHTGTEITAGCTLIAMSGVSSICNRLISQPTACLVMGRLLIETLLAVGPHQLLGERFPRRDRVDEGA